MRRRSLLSVALLVASVFPLVAQQSPVGLDPPRTEHDLREQQRLAREWCGWRPGVDRDDVSRRRDAKADGDLVWFRQEPLLLTGSYAGRLRFAELTVRGDVAAVRFARYDRSTGGESIEVWPRAATKTIGTTLVSVFEPSWDEATVRDVLRAADVGYDQAQEYFGRYLGPDDGSDRDVPVYLRLGLGGLSPVPVVRIDDTAQYSSHVVNLVIPAFGVERLEDEYGFDIESAARKFYQHFDDSYEILTFIPELSHPAKTFVAFHRDVQNTVSGIGMARFSATGRYGSNGVLLGAEVFAQDGYAENSLANHELSHSWGHNFDWRLMAGLERTDIVHPPLFTGGESMLGVMLRPWLRVGGTDEAPVIESTPVYAKQHPLELYAMGLLEPTAVPAIRVFTNQAQFDESGPFVGAPVVPDAKVVTIDDVIRHHGPRQGPVYREIRRAAVVVTRDRLLSADEMAYWNFVAARQEDPNRTGMFDYLGQPSFDFTTGLRVDLKTGIRPTGAEPVGPTQQVDFPAFGSRECQGITFEPGLPSRYVVGQRARISGKVTAGDRSDFNQILVRYWRRGGTSTDAVREWTEVSRSGMFELQVEFRDGQQGIYAFEAFLFWPDAGVQLARCSLTPITVSDAPAPTSARR